MALQKEVVTPYGVTANYFKISGIEINTILKTAKIKLNGYYNEEARLDDSRSLLVKDYKVESDKYDMYFEATILNEVNNNILKMGYEYIKANDEVFYDAISDEV